MRSGTSFFNAALWRKTMGRFWPLWALYAAAWTFALPLYLLNQFVGGRSRGYGAVDVQDWMLSAAQEFPSWLSFGVWVSCIFGLLCAMAVFGYLYNARSSCAMHALPLRREGLFTTQYLAGLSFGLLPHLAVALCTAAIEMVLLPPDAWLEALSCLGIWLLVQSATFLFFFSFAAFCAMFTGHLLALPAFYAILNGLVWGLYGLLTLLFSQFFYGYSTSASYALMDLLTPLYPLSDACRWQVVDAADYTTVPISYELASPLTVAGYAVAGLVLALLALLLYRRRHVESAGDVVSFRVVRPIFQWGVTFCVGLSFGMATSLFFSWSDNAAFLSVCVVLWSVVGFFAAEMLLKKSFRVLGAWKRGLIALVVMSLLCGGCFADVFGIETRVPKADQVASLSVVLDLGEPYDDGRQLALELTDPEDMAPFIALHQAVVDQRDRAQYNSPSYAPGDNYFSLSLYYTLGNGATVNRQYHSIPIYRSESEDPSTVSGQYFALLQNRELVAKAYAFDHYGAGRLVEVCLSGVELPRAEGSGQDPQYQDPYYLEDATPQQLEQLWEAVQEDFAAGTLGVRYAIPDQERWDNTYQTDLRFTFELTRDLSGNVEKTYSSDLSITLTPNAKNTLAWLEQYGGLNTQYYLIAHESTGDALPGTQSQPQPDGPSAEVYPLG